MKKIFFAFLLTALSTVFLFNLNSSTAQAQVTTLNGLDQTANEIDAFKSKTGDQFQNDFLQTQIGQIISTVLSFIGALFLILMIYAGISWMVSEGNEQKVTKAKELLINAIIGIIIVFAAYAITSFLGTQLIK